MKMQKPENYKEIVSYYKSLESRLTYAILGGIKHFGYYPSGKNDISLRNAQNRMSDELGKRLNLTKGSLILDAGCGEGSVSLYLAQKYDAKFIGLDILDFNIKRAQAKAKKLGIESKISFRVMDYTNLEFKQNTFDRIFTMESFVHVPDYQRTLKNFYRVLKPGGKIVMFEYTMASEKDLSSSQQKMANIITTGSAMWSLPNFTHGKLQKILKDAHFRKIQHADITKQVIPFLKYFHRYVYIPYFFIKLFGLQKKFVNLTATVEGYENSLKSKVWAYNILSAEKPL